MSKIRITLAVTFLTPALILLGSGTAEQVTIAPHRSNGPSGSLPIVYQIQLQVRADTGGTAFNLPNGSTFNSVTANLNDAGNVAVKVNTIALTTVRDSGLAATGAARPSTTRTTMTLS